MMKESGGQFLERAGFPPPFDSLSTQHYNKKMFCLVKNKESFFFFFKCFACFT